jgi:hypothetical protein
MCDVPITVTTWSVLGWTKHNVGVYSSWSAVTRMYAAIRGDAPRNADEWMVL